MKAGVCRVTFDEVQPVGTVGLLCLPCEKVADSASGIPMNTGESLVTYTPQFSALNFRDLQTSDLQGVITKVATLETKCFVFNHFHNGSPSGAEFKLYPKGYITTGAIEDNIIFAGVNTFEFQKLASNDYIPAGPSSGKGVRERQQLSERWLFSLAQALQPQLQGQCSEECLDFLDSICKTRTTSRSKTENKPTTLGSLSDAMKNCEKLESLLLPRTSEEEAEED
jgi:hypothetical protein